MAQGNMGSEIAEFSSNNGDDLKRGLKSRHLSMIAIGGAIGTGLFLGSGGTISSAGPLGALLAYAAVGLMVYFVMTGLGEMATFLPVAGSFETYATRFVDPALGFALGWNYWFTWVCTLPAELTAGAVIMKYWFPNSSAWIWSLVFLVIIFLLNAISVRGYGEGEYWFAGIKVITILVFLVIGVLMILGILGGHTFGFSVFNTGGSPIHGGFTGWFGTVLIAGFAFQGTELVGLAAGESENPAKNVPKAIRQVFWRILIFYILAIFVVGMLIPYTDPHLLNPNNDVTQSPFTLVFKRAGLAVAASIMNAVILTAVLSAGNSSLYASTRMLWALANSGKAPRFLAKLTKHKVPIVSLLINTLLGCIAFLDYTQNASKVYIWALNAASLTGFLAWLGIAISHYRFRKAYVRQGRDLNDLVYKAKWYPFGPLLAFVLCLVVIVFQDYTAFTGGAIDWNSVIAMYCGIPLFLLTWIGYKIFKRSKVVPLEECDFSK